MGTFTAFRIIAITLISIWLQSVLAQTPSPLHSIKKFNISFSDETILYAQTEPPSEELAIASQFFPDFPEFACQGADDFTVPEGSAWILSKFVFPGVYSADPPGGPAPLANLFILADDGGHPGIPLFELPQLPVLPSTGGNLEIMLPFDLNLMSGVYWISVQANMPYNPLGQWYWAKQAAPVIGQPLHWQNPGGGFELPGTLSWASAQEIPWPSGPVSDLNFSFIIYGYEAGTCQPQSSLRVGDWHNPEPWHNWIGGITGSTEVQLTVDPGSGCPFTVQMVVFSYLSPDNTWIPFHTDHDGSQIPEDTYGTLITSGNGWQGTLYHNLLPQQDFELFIKAVAFLDNGEMIETTASIFYDPTPPSEVILNVEDFMIIDGNEILLDIEPGNCTDLSKVLVELIPKPEEFNKGVPHIQQPPGSTICAPVAATACLKWFESQGDVVVTGGLTNEALIDSLKNRCKTNQGKSGTNPDDLAEGLKKWIEAHGDGYTVRGPLPFDWKEMRNELERGQDVLSGIVWKEGGGHRMTFNSIKNQPEPDGKIRVDFMDPVTGNEEWGYLDPNTGELTGFTGGGAEGTLGNTIIICPKQPVPLTGPGTQLDGPNPPLLSIPVESPGKYFLRIQILDNSNHQSRFDLVMVKPEPADQPVIESMDSYLTHYGESVRVNGRNFTIDPSQGCIVMDGELSPVIPTFSGFFDIFFDCPDLPPGPHVLQIMNGGGQLSNPVTFETYLPENVWFLSPNENDRIMNDTLSITVAPPIFADWIDSVRFYVSHPDLPEKVYLGTDNDGTSESYGTLNPAGSGKGWNLPVYIYNERLEIYFDPAYSVSAEAFSKAGHVFTGSTPARIDYPPYSLKINEENSKTAGGKTPENDSIVIEFEIDNNEVLNDIIAGARPMGGFDFVRILKHVDQDTVSDVKDKDGKDISGYICGPVAAAVCLDWLKRNSTGTGVTDINKLIRELAKKAGTKHGEGTRDDELEKAIREVAEKSVHGIPGIKTERHFEKPYRHIGRNLRDSADVIILIQQKKKQPDGTTDTVGHFVTVSSHHSEIQYQPMTGPNGEWMGCVAVQKDYIDFMDPSTGETVYKEAKWYNDPVTITDYDVPGSGSNVGDGWVGGTIVVKKSNKAVTPPEDFAWMAAITPNEDDTYRVSIPCADIPEGLFEIEILAQTSDGTEVNDKIMIVNGAPNVFAGFEADIRLGAAPLTVTFNNLSLPAGQITSWHWDFGDGFSSDESNPVHVYDFPGMFDVSLVVSGGVTSDTAFRSDFITVMPGVTHNISIPSGWSGFSGYVQPNDPALESVMQPIMDELVMMRNLTQLFWPEQGINTIGNFNPKEGYIVKVTENTTLEIQGIPLSDLSFQLESGWNIIPVPVYCNVPVQQVLGSIINQVVICMEIAGNGIFWPALNIQTLHEFVPGRAYFLKLSEPVNVSFPDCGISR